jgi:hypothetical protein
MKKLFGITIYLFYRYYNKRSTKIIAYESAIMAVAFLLYMNLFALFIALKIDFLVINFLETDNGFVELFRVSLLLLPLILFLGAAFRKGNIISQNYDLSKIKKWNVMLICYVVFSVLAIAFLIWVFKGFP